MNPLQIKNKENIIMFLVYDSKYKGIDDAWNFTYSSIEKDILICLSDNSSIKSVGTSRQSKLKEKAYLVIDDVL